MKWVCCQIGARERYAIPRALRRLDLLACFITDAWISPSSFLAKTCGPKLADRFHQELRGAPVIAFNSSFILCELLSRAQRRKEWEAIMARNRWFQKEVVEALTSDVRHQISDSPIVLSYSYAALEPFRYAKSRGWKTVLVQIDPGPEEERIVADEVGRMPSLAGEWQPAPAQYWKDWRQECDLADRVIVNSEWSREGLMRSGILPEKLSMIPLAYEEEDVRHMTSDENASRLYPARFSQERPLRVLFLGQVNLRKGIARLLDAARILENEPVEFWIAGPVQIANSSTLADNTRIKWLGPLTRNQTAKIYKAADVFILPTLSDGFAITQLEAQAHRLPIISSGFCGSVVEDGRNGIVLQDPSGISIAAAIRDCMADPGRLQIFAAASQIADEFTIDALGNRLRELGLAL